MVSDGARRFSLLARSDLPRRGFAPTRAALDSLSLEPELLAWVRTASDLQLREQLLMRIEWVCGAPKLADRAAALTRAVAARIESFGTCPAKADAASMQS